MRTVVINASSQTIRIQLDALFSASVLLASVLAGPLDEEDARAGDQATAREGQLDEPGAQLESRGEPVVDEGVGDIAAPVGAALAGAEIEMLGFEGLPERTAPGDFVYLDPPYHPRSATSNFTAYTASPFGEEEQAELAKVCRRLDARGVRFMLSNTEAPFVRDLYDGFRIDRVFAARAINSRPSGRGKIPEIVVRNYGG